MARSGIYVNGKEVVARYVGDKLLWRKNTEKLFLSVLASGIWSTPSSRPLATQTSDISSSSRHEDIEVTISKVSVGNRSWEAEKFGYFYTRLYADVYRIATRITFKNFHDKKQFQDFMNSQSHQVTINLYKKE